MQPHKFPTILIVVLTIALLSLTLGSAAWAAEYKVLYKFKAREGDGVNPQASVILDAAGNLYGTTYYGGDPNCYCGVVFKLTPNPDGTWTHTILHAFTGGADGKRPAAGLIFDMAGNLYGTTERGGGGCFEGCGLVFKLTPNPDGSWTNTLLHAFKGPGGTYPHADLIFDAAGNLYGTTIWGGAYDLGIVFKLTPNPDGSWTESKLHTFKGADGAIPYAGVTFDAAGNLYGTTTGGGAYGLGTVFKLTPNPDGSWTKSKLHAFKGTDGAEPYGGVVLDAAGNLYGTTFVGGTYGLGTVFKLTPNPDGSWKKSKLHVFKGLDGARPFAGLFLDYHTGNLYGTTYGGGPYGGGTVFKLTPNPDGSWTKSKLHAFKGDQYPMAGLVMDAAGNLYGTASGGNNGLVFRITP